MGKKSTSTKANRSAAKKPATTHGVGRPILEAADVRTIVSELAAQIAPGDVEAIIENESQLRTRAAELQSGELPLLGEQLILALDCLRDHADGTCPQIPYYTISLLAAAVCYFTDELDVIPDFLPHIGRLDDAAVMAVAYQLGAAGLQRYCDWKGRDLGAVLCTPRVHA